MKRMRRLPAAYECTQVEKTSPPQKAADDNASAEPAEYRLSPPRTARPKNNAINNQTVQPRASSRKWQHCCYARAETRGCVSRCEPFASANDSTHLLESAAVVEVVVGKRNWNCNASRDDTGRQIRMGPHPLDPTTNRPLSANNIALADH